MFTEQSSADILQNEAAKAIGIAAISGHGLPVPSFFREIWPLLQKRSLESVEQFVSSDTDNTMDCRLDASNLGWWLNTRAASDLPRSVSIFVFLLFCSADSIQYADNIHGRNILIDRLRRIRDATETVADNTRSQIEKYGEGMLEVVQVIDAFRAAVYKKPSRDYGDSPPRQDPSAGVSSLRPTGDLGLTQMPIPSTSTAPPEIIDLTD